ncbi:stage III sporulation protein AG [Clostridium sp.]|uniref:stage III sporulation protein AG n=1 Tax=Clostridium sp. TaxID=1506 RepID=UPI0034638FDD
MDLKKFLKTLESKGLKKNFYNILIVLLVGILVLMIGSFFNSNTNTKGVAATPENVENKEVSKDENLSTYEQTQKNQLKYILSNISGIGKVEVMISFEGSTEHVPAMDNNNSISKTEEKDTSGGTRVNTQNNNGNKVVITNDGKNNEPFILKTLNPKVSGVVIVAEGAENKELQYKITKTVSALYNIPEHKVNVYSMKK